LVEAAFVQLQSAKPPDPFKFTIDYFGYDHFQRVTSFLELLTFTTNRGICFSFTFYSQFLTHLPRLP
jgi:hypothetical protein